MAKHAFGKILRAMRQKRGFSQADFAKLCGLSQSNLSRYEAGVNEPTLGALRKIASGLGIKPSMLIK